MHPEKKKKGGSCQRISHDQKSAVTYAEQRELEPNDEQRLESKIPRNVVENDPASETFEESEETEHDPICEPLNVIMRRR